MIANPYEYDDPKKEFTELLIDCPKCGVNIEIDDADVGTSLYCPLCNTHIEICEYHPEE